jgi:hypothetical protein
MKKLNKLSFEQLSEEIAVISPNILDSILGGTGIDGYCLFYALAYLSNGTHDVNYYLNQYGHTYGYCSLLPNASGYIQGISATNATTFVGSNFTSTSISSSGIATAPGSGGRVLTDMKIMNGTSHAIIITGIASTGYGTTTECASYNYLDPQNGTSGTIDENQINASMLMRVN